MGLDRRSHRPVGRQRFLCSRRDHLIIGLRFAAETGDLDIIQPSSLEGSERGVASARCERNE